MSGPVERTTCGAGVTPGAALSLFVVVGALVVVAAAVPATTAGTGGPSANASVFGLQPPDGDLRPDETVFRVRVTERGTAEWEAEYRYRLEPGPERSAFERVRRNVTNPPGTFKRNLSLAVETANRETERSMTVQNVSVATEIGRSPGNQDPVGVVRYRFEWTNFADREGSRYVAGTRTLSTMRLERNQTLAFTWTEALRLRSAAPDPTANLTGEVVWTGPRTFRPAPTVELTRVGGASGGVPVVPVAVGTGALLLVAGLAGWRLYGDDTDDDPDSASSTDGDAGELLTDEERVLHLLEERGGRMKQQEVVEAVDWSRTKASDVVNEMNDAGQIEIYRLGRENVLALPGEIDV